MKRLLLCTVTALALAACQEEDAPTAEEAGAAPTESSQSQPATENTATADDGGGAMDGADDETAEESTASRSEVTQDAIDACIDALRAQEGSVGGTVQSTEFSEANSLVILLDQTGNTWRCLVSNDASSASIEAQDSAAGTEEAATADDGGGAMDGSSTDEAIHAVGSPTDVTEFVGAPAGQAPGGLRALGFEAIRSEGLTTFWFNRETGACARITTSDGVFSEVVMLPAEDC